MNKCIDCGSKTSRKETKRCRPCYKEANSSQCLKITEPIKKYLYRQSNNPNYYVKIRQNARRVAKYLGMLDCGCSKCPFKHGVEVCHIKAIADFDESTPMNVVNHPSNLVVLCPNCHWMFDHPE